MRVEPKVPAAELTRLRAPLLLAGAQPVEPALLQPLGLLLDLAGEAMRARLFVVQAEGAEESCLRPDFTVAIARDHLAAGGGAGRYIYEGSAFRASSRPDRPDQFVQLGLELFSAIGPPALDADLEAVGLAWQSAVAGGRDDLTLWLGDVALFSAFIASLGLPDGLAARLERMAGRPRLLQAELARAEAPRGQTGEGRLAAILGGLPPAEAAALLEEVWALAGVEPVGGRGPVEIAQRLVQRAEAAASPALTAGQADAIRSFMAIADHPQPALAQVRSLAGAAAAFDAALDLWSTRLAALSSLAPPERLRFAPALGHAFDYYDGLTFEVRSEALGADRPVAVGGRYDSLLERLGGPAGQAVGCMVRPWRAWRGGEA